MKKSCGVAAVGLWMQFVPALLEASQERWALTEEVRFEGSSSLPLSNIETLVAAPDGTVFVAGRGDAAIHRLAPSGEYDGAGLDASTLWLRFTLPGGMHAAAEQPWSTRDLLAVSPGGDGFAIVRGRGTWVRQQDVEGSRWVVFDRAGASVAEVAAPEDLDLHHLSADHAWGVREDAFGTPIVYRYAISRG